MGVPGAVEARQDSAPAAKEVSGMESSAVADQGGVVTQHSWKPFHLPWPLWYVKRVSDVKEANWLWGGTRVVSH